MNEGLKESTMEGRNEGCFELRSKEVKLILTAILLIRYQWCEINPNSHFVDLQINPNCHFVDP